ncbi:MAG TPA: tetratricopeptide repeat protein [Pyrinomonadaceae bacterium]|nr:tetratricopeptide repeat protein [Pyrinomonadaceae bacterium]
MTLEAQLSRTLSLLVCLLAAAALAEAQPKRPVDTPEIGRPNADDRQPRGSIKGRVLLPDGSYVSGNVKLTLQTLRDTITTIYTDGLGQFEFTDLVPGNYQIEADPTDRAHFDVTSEQIQVFKGTPSILNITLKPRAPAKTTRAITTTSVAELDRSIPNTARKEFEKANHAVQNGLADEAIAHFRKAIEIYPGFVMARNDLGVQLFARGQLEEAAEELQRAVKLDAKAFNPALNLGMVLVHLHRFAEADEILNRARAIQPNSAAAKLYAGMALKGLDNLDAAAECFKSAYETGGKEFAEALFYLGEIYMARGDRAAALDSFERYVTSSPDAANANQARRMIAMLR